MFYPLQTIGDYLSFQSLGREEFNKLPPQDADIIISHMGRHIGSCGVFGTVFYDVAHAGEATSPIARKEVARANIWLATTLELIDDTIDNPTTERNGNHIETFLDNCRDTIVAGTQHDVVPAVALHKQQLACYELSGYIYNNWFKGHDDRQGRMDHALKRLKEPVMQQFKAEEPNELLEIAKDTTGFCTEAATLNTVFVDNKEYPNVIRSAYHFGAMAGVMDHATEILDDLKEGTATFATAYIRKHGAGAASLQNIASIAAHTVREQYDKGMAMLETNKQRSIYRFASTILIARDNYKRFIRATTPKKVEKALRLSPQHNNDAAA